MWESRAIMQYVMNEYAPTSSLYPKDPAARAKIDSILQYDQGEFYKSVSQYIYKSVGIRAGQRDNPEEIKEFWKQVDFIENNLIKGKYLTGDSITIADISLAMGMNMPMVYLGDNCYKDHPKIKAWHREMAQCKEFNEESKKFRKGMKIFEYSIVQHVVRAIQWIKS